MKKIGKNTVAFEVPPLILSSAGVVGPKESEGPLSRQFDRLFSDSMMGQDSFEKAESYLQERATEIALRKAGKKAQDISFVFAGDLLNQCIASTFSLRDTNIPFCGVYGACSTMALSLIQAAVYASSVEDSICLAVTSSHFCSAERQYRFPLEYGGVRPLSAQWTVTGAGAALVGSGESGIGISSFTMGRIVDYGITDQNNMGAAMAPAAADTIKRYFEDTKTAPSDYDAIFTGDLGVVGSELLCELLLKEGIDLSSLHHDCGLMIFDRERQDVHSGGSGCGCSASVLCSYILNQMKKGELNNILFIATGALLSPTSVTQGETIPTIAHLLNIKQKIQ